MVRGRFAADAVSHSRTGLEPGKPPIGGPPAWMLVGRVWQIGHDSGCLVVVHALVAIDGFDTRPSAEQIAPSLKSDGWMLRTSSPGGGLANSLPKSFYQGIDQWRAAGFGCFSTMRGPVLGRIVQVPLWFLAVVALMPALLILRRQRQRLRSLRSGRCTRCGYALSSAMKVCPECGQDASGNSIAPTV